MRDLIGFKDCYWWISDILQLKYKKKNIKFNNKLKLLREEKLRFMSKNILFTGAGGSGNELIWQLLKKKYNIFFL